MTAEPPESPVTEAVCSLEVRWIFPGQLETAVARWFARFPATVESREDTYLLDPRSRSACSRPSSRVPSPWPEPSPNPRRRRIPARCRRGGSAGRTGLCAASRHPRRRARRPAAACAPGLRCAPACPGHYRRAARRLWCGTAGRGSTPGEQAARKSPCKEDDRAACSAQSAAGPGSGATPRPDRAFHRRAGGSGDRIHPAGHLGVAQLDVRVTHAYAISQHRRAVPWEIVNGHRSTPRRSRGSFTCAVQA